MGTEAEAPTLVLPAAIVAVIGGGVVRSHGETSTAVGVGVPDVGSTYASAKSTREVKAGSER